MTELNTSDGKIGFIIACVMTGITALIAVMLGLQNGWTETGTLFAYCVVGGLAVWSVWKYIQWKREN